MKKQSNTKKAPTVAELKKELKSTKIRLASALKTKDKLGDEIAALNMQVTDLNGSFLAEMKLGNELKEELEFVKTQKDAYKQVVNGLKTKSFFWLIKFRFFNK